MCEHINGLETCQCRQTNGRPHVVGEDQECATEWHEPTMQRDAVQHRAHRVFAHAVVEVAAGVATFDLGVVRAGEIRRPADQLGESCGERVQDFAGGRAGCLRVLRAEDRQRRVPPGRQPAADPAFQLGGQIGMRRAVGIPFLAPVGFQPSAPGLGAAPMRERLVWYVEGLERWPAEVLLRGFHFVDAQRRAVRVGGVLLVRAAPRDVGPHDDERRAVGDALRLRDCVIDRVQIVAIGDALHVPAVGLEPLGGVVGEREVGGAVDRDAIVVVEPDQLAELQMTRERARLVRDALH